jgi:hypothetical protein
VSSRWLILALALIMVCIGPLWAQSVQNPRRIAKGRKGQMLVTDRASGSIIALDRKSLAPAWSFQLPEEGAPFGLATWNRRVYVGNTATGNVEVYRVKGPRSRRVKVTFLYNLGHTPPGESGTMDNPISIAIDRNAGLVFVLDGGNKSVEVFNRDGVLVNTFFPLDDAREVLSPVSIAVDEKRREVLVSDFGDPSGSFRTRTPARILIYDYDGTLLFQINGNGSTHENTYFTRVQGIDTSNDGRIFASDPLGCRIFVLDRLTGELLSEIGAAGTEPGQLMLPLDVYLHKRSGDLFVSNNRGARRVEVFREAGRSR